MTKFEQRIPISMNASRYIIGAQDNKNSNIIVQE